MFLSTAEEQEEQRHDVSNEPLLQGAEHAQLIAALCRVDGAVHRQSCSA